MFRAPSGEGVDIDDRRPSTTPARTACTAPPTALLFPVDMGKDTQRTEKEPRWCCSACPPARPSLIMRSQKGGGLRNNPIPTVRTPLSRVHVRIVVKVLIEIFFRLRFCAASAIAVPAASPQLHTSLPVLYMSLVCLSVFFSIRKNRRLITETEACICH